MTRDDTLLIREGLTDLVAHRKELARDQEDDPELGILRRRIRKDPKKFIIHDKHRYEILNDILVGMKPDEIHEKRYALPYNMSGHRYRPAASSTDQK